MYFVAMGHAVFTIIVRIVVHVHNNDEHADTFKFYF